MRKMVIIMLFALILTAVPPDIMSTNVYGDGDRFNMSYIYFGDPGLFKDQVKKAEGCLDEVAPTYFDLTAEGSLSISQVYSADFVRDMHQMGIKVVPFLSNHWDRQRGRQALSRRSELADEIVSAVINLNLDGVNVDIENLTEKDRDNYTDFVRILREKLPADKSLSVAVAANPAGGETGWQGSYDYSALAEYSDYLMVMAYDESYAGSSPGPVASIKFVENSVRYAISKVSREKVVLGVPFYGRYWNHSESRGGYGMGIPDVEMLINKYSGQVYFDREYMCPRAEVTVTANEYIFAGQKVLRPGTYTIWFEDSLSLVKKLNIVEKYNIKGTGSWSLGHEPTGIWDFYGHYLNGLMFDDIINHWAFDHILSVTEKGWMKGVSDIKFSPGTVTTRAQAAVILVRALGLDEESKLKHSFNDIEGHWAEKEIAIAWEYGYMVGMDYDIFGPDLPVTREQMAVLLDRIFMPPLRYEVEYDDVSYETNAWSCEAIWRMSSIGVFSGYPDGTFRPRDYINRAQMSALLNRLEPHAKQYKSAN